MKAENFKVKSPSEGNPSIGPKVGCGRKEKIMCTWERENWTAIKRSGRKKSRGEDVVGKREPISRIMTLIIHECRALIC